MKTGILKLFEGLMKAESLQVFQLGAGATG
jgi:hypothetical protein